MVSPVHSGMTSAAPLRHAWRKRKSLRTSSNGYSTTSSAVSVTRTGGIVSAVAEVYNRAAYLPEMREGIALWESHVAACITGMTDTKHFHGAKAGIVGHYASMKA